MPTKTAQHTPTPWFIRENALGITIHGDHNYAAYGERSRYIAEFSNQEIADADFIILAVNSHAQLVEAIIQAQHFIEAVSVHANSQDEKIRVNMLSKAALKAAGVEHA